ncbi:hypothetical protein B0T13DRAFT_451117 [Neurospora crassa]|nr:hypothetical protein B0T13DRAFT_451117 [Neurospora crassa]
MTLSRPKTESRPTPAKRVVYRDEGNFRPSDHHKRKAEEQAPSRPRKSRRLERSQGKKYDEEALFGTAAFASSTSIQATAPDLIPSIRGSSGFGNKSAASEVEIPTKSEYVQKAKKNTL